jgi:nucleotide-binding universal stress UspA family protein
MKILLAADGSVYTKKALAFLVTHEALLDADGELHVLHVQPALPPRVKSVAGKDLVAQHHLREAEAVLKPIRAFLDHHPITYHADWVVGNPAIDILKMAKKDKSHMIVMGTHGHGLLGRMLMGSVAQRVVAESDLPVLLVQ